MGGAETIVVEETTEPGPLQTSDSPGLSPEDLLKAEQAKQQLRQLQVQEVADLIPVMQRMIEAVIRRLEQVIEQQSKVVKQNLELHELLMKDAEAQFEILKVFQSTLIVLDQVNEPAVLKAETVKPEGKS